MVDKLGNMHFVHLVTLEFYFFCLHVHGWVMKAHVHGLIMKAHVPF
jgi:hypothetical protein